MSQVEISAKLWLENMLMAIGNFCSAVEGFAKYENSHLYTMYTNYLDYAYMCLDDMMFYEFIEAGHAPRYGVSTLLLNRLLTFRDKVETFFRSSGELSDFEVIRCKDWDEIIPLAKECHEGLKKLYNKLPDDPEE